jgi:hypothetical protein
VKCFVDMFVQKVISTGILLISVNLVSPCCTGSDSATLGPVFAQVAHQPHYVSLSSPPSCCFGFFLLICLFIFCFVFILFVHHLYFPPLLFLYSMYVFPSVLADCTLGAPKLLNIVSSTPPLPQFNPIGCHHTY